MVEYPVDKPVLRAHICRKDQKSSLTRAHLRNSETVFQLKVTTISEMKPIDYITVPQSWRKVLNHPAEGAYSTSITFIPSDSHSANLSIFDRGVGVGSVAAERFKTLLSLPSHILSEGEVNSLGCDLLDTIGDTSAFTIIKAETRPIGGKRLLRISGEWRSGGKQFVGYFFPNWAHKSGPRSTDFHEVKEVFYEGNEPEFSIFLSDAQSAMASIVWTPLRF